MGWKMAQASTLELPEGFLTHNPVYLLAKNDPAVFLSVYQELQRQIKGLEMIASENFVSPTTLAAAGTVGTNKYAEGYPGDRYYGGCEHIDEVESLGIERAKALFGAQHANIQPHSGTTMNQAAIFALIEAGGKILSMDLKQGGHLSHGAPVNAIGQFYEISHYGVDEETGRIDYDNVLAIAKEVRPDLIVAGGSAYPREVNFAKFREIADEVGAYLLADIAHHAGQVAAGIYNSPIDQAHVTTTTTHKTLRGARGGMILLGKDYEMMMPWGKKQRRLLKAIDAAVFPGEQGGPLEHLITAKAVALGEALNADGTAVSQEFIDYQRQVVQNAQTLARYFAAHGYELSTGGTDTHLILVKRPRNLTGLAAQHATEEIGITINKNSGPNDKGTPKVPDYVRVGTPAITTRGMGVKEMHVIGEALDMLFRHTTENGNHNPIIADGVVDTLKPTIDELVEKFPLYPELLEQFDYVASHPDINLN
tara:strand:+ start:301 stop:1740 length:1440 start_codon:yes stop_codon:yes gene_type:complete